jgi:hypothetical protein
MNPFPAGLTHTFIAVRTFLALGVIFTGGIDTARHFFCTIIPGPALRTLAGIGRDAIHTGALILARVRRVAIVDIHFTGLAFEAVRTRTTDRRVALLRAFTTVLTGLGIAMFDIRLTICAREFVCTLTGICVDAIDACAAILTGFGRAIVDIRLAIVAVESGRAFAAIALPFLGADTYVLTRACPRLTLALRITAIAVGAWKSVLIARLALKRICLTTFLRVAAVLHARRILRTLDFAIFREIPLRVADKALVIGKEGAGVETYPIDLADIFLGFVLALVGGVANTDRAAIAVIAGAVIPKGAGGGDFLHTARGVGGPAPIAPGASGVGTHRIAHTRPTALSI